MTFKQKTLQISSVFGATRVVSTALCVSCIAILPALAQMMPKGSAQAGATMRLVAAPGSPGGRYEVGVAIAMGPGSHTYWKMPGEAGVPPVFAFNGSQNTASATVAFPAPTRITEDGLDAFGYTNLVVFPVSVVAIDPAKPVVLQADVRYAVCNKICLPAHDKATLTLTPKGAGVDPSILAAALETVPREPSGDEAKAIHIARVDPSKAAASAPKGDSGKPSWTISWTGTGIVEDVFADAPEGFFFTTKKIGPASWLLVETQGVGLVSHEGIPVSLTFKRQGGSLAVMEKLDAAKPIQ